MSPQELPNRPPLDVPDPKKVQQAKEQKQAKDSTLWGLRRLAAFVPGMWMAFPPGAESEEKSEEDPKSILEAEKREREKARQKEKEEFEKLKEQLGRGEIPEGMAEDLRLVNPDSPEVQEFQQIVQSILDVIYAEAKEFSYRPDYDFMIHDFKANPVKILLAKNDTPNACYIRYSKPPTFVFTTGLFPKKGESLASSKTFVKTIHDLAAIALHEMTHMKMREVYGKDLDNSKVEEGFAYAYPLILMSEKGGPLGLNPEKLMDAGGKEGLFNVMRNLDESNPWFEYLDVHPSKGNIDAVVNVTLAGLKQRKGTLKPKGTPEAAPYAMNDPLLNAVQNAQHLSYVDKKLKESGDYEAASCVRKAEILKGIINGLDKVYSARIDDLYAEIRKLKPLIKTEDDQFAVHELADAVLELSDKGHMAAMRRLYRACSIALETNGPLGSLVRIDIAARKLIKAVADYDGNPAAIVAASQELNAQLEKDEPLFSHQAGLEFLTSIQWAQFPFPDLDARRPRGRGVRVSWAALRKIAREHRDVAKACIHMGLAFDPLVFQAVCEQDDLALQRAGKMNQRAMLGATPNVVDTFSKYSTGPAFEGTKIMDLEFNAAGEVISVGVGKNTSAERNNATFSQYLESFLERDFIESKNDPAALRRLFFALSQWQSIQHDQLFFLNLMEKNFEVFLLVNENELGTSSGLSIAKLLGAIKDKPNLIRELYLSKHGQKTLDAGIQGFGTFSERGQRETELTVNPFLRFLLREDMTALTKEEKRAVLEYLFLDKNPQRPGQHSYFYLVAHSLSTERALVYKKSVHPLFKGTPEEYAAPRSWPVLLKLCRTSVSPKELTLLGTCLCAEGVALIAEKTPTFPEIVEFIELFGQELFKDSVFIREARQKLQRSALRFIEKDLKTLPLQDAIRLAKSAIQNELFFPDAIDASHGVLVARAESLAEALSLEERIERCLELLGEPRISKPDLRERTIRTLTQSALQLHGTDKGNAAHQERMVQLIDRVIAKVHRVDRNHVLHALAKTLQFQNALSHHCMRRAYEVTKDALAQSPFKMVLADMCISKIRSSPNRRRSLLDFLTSPLTDASIGKFYEDNRHILSFVTETGTQLSADSMEYELSSELSKKEKEFMKKYGHRALKNLHENFWAYPLEARAVFVRELIVNTEGKLGVVDKETFDYVIGKMFAKSSYEEKARMFLGPYVNALEPYMREVFLGAMLSAVEKKDAANLSIGQALAFFLENMGPAETKFGQAMQSHPMVPEEIRRDLRHLKYRPDERPRWEVTRWVEEVRADIEKQCGERIVRIGEYSGSGSIQVTVEVEMSDGSTHVLALLRPNVVERAHAGFDALKKMLANLVIKPGEEAIVKTMQELIAQASERVELEASCPKAMEQYGQAISMYRGVTVNVRSRTYTMNAPAVLAAGEQFFLMQKMEGSHFVEGNGGKKEQAMAILTVEFNNILSGKFDCDRHGGNIRVDEKNQAINHFDFKAMALRSWSERGYRQFAEIFVGTLLSGKNSAHELLLGLVEQERVLREALEKKGETIDPFVTEALKALLSLAEYMDPKILTQGDVQQVAVSALLNGIDPKMQDAIVLAIKNKVCSNDEERAEFDTGFGKDIRTSITSGKLASALVAIIPVADRDIVRINRPSEAVTSGPAATILAKLQALRPLDAALREAQLKALEGGLKLVKRNEELDRRIAKDSSDLLPEIRTLLLTSQKEGQPAPFTQEEIDQLVGHPDILAFGPDMQMEYVRVSRVFSGTRNYKAQANLVGEHPVYIFSFMNKKAFLDFAKQHDVTLSEAAIATEASFAKAKQDLFAAIAAKTKR